MTIWAFFSLGMISSFYGVENLGDGKWINFQAYVIYAILISSGLNFVQVLYNGALSAVTFFQNRKYKVARRKKKSKKNKISPNSKKKEKQKKAKFGSGRFASFMKGRWRKRKNQVRQPSLNLEKSLRKMSVDTLQSPVKKRKEDQLMKNRVKKDLAFDQLEEMNTPNFVIGSKEKRNRLKTNGRKRKGRKHEILKKRKV
jgi:hypothetical protein